MRFLDANITEIIEMSGEYSKRGLDQPCPLIGVWVPDTEDFWEKSDREVDLTGQIVLAGGRLDRKIELFDAEGDACICQNPLVFGL